MREFKLYLSGILYAYVYFENNTTFIKELNVFTNKFLEKEELSSEKNKLCKSIYKIDLHALSKKISSYDKCFSTNEKYVVTPFGEKYELHSPGNFVQRDIKFPNNILFEDGKVIAIVCPSREYTSILVENGFEDKTILKKWKEEIPSELHPVKYKGCFDVLTRDNIKLSTDVYLPADIRKNLPTILVRTPYGKEMNKETYYKFVQRGYAVVIQDVRGRNFSEGNWEPQLHEVEDGDDTINWIVNQPWSSKKVGMIGGSYLGYVQWAAAASNNPYLAALVSIVCAGSAFVDIPRRGGALISGMLAWSFAVSQQIFKPELMVRDDWDEVLDIRPLNKIPEKALGYKVNFLEEWLKRTDYDEYWAKINWHDRCKNIKVPALIMSGWFDDNGMGTTEALDLTKDYPQGKRKIILGPWQHSGNSTYDLHNVPFGTNALRFDLDLIFLKWFDLHLKGIQNGIDKTPTVEYYTVGDNEWKTANNWPVESSKPTAIYLTSNGHANTSSGDGKLVFEEVSDEKFDEYAYDPKNPSTFIIDMSENEIGVPEDYTEEEKRDDILCYTTDTLEEDLIITGDIDVELYISSDAVDTDFMVRITDVDKNGKSIKLADGIISAKYRNSFDKAEYLEKDKVYKINILTTKISNTFKKGHKIRFTVTSSAKNFVFPNSNTKDSFNSVETVIANNKIHHGGQYPSRIIVKQEI